MVFKRVTAIFAMIMAVFSIAVGCDVGNVDVIDTGQTTITEMVAVTTVTNLPTETMATSITESEVTIMVSHICL